MQTSPISVFITRKSDDVRFFRIKDIVKASYAECSFVWYDVCVAYSPGLRKQRIKEVPFFLMSRMFKELMISYLFTRWVIFEFLNTTVMKCYYINLYTYYVAGWIWKCHFFPLYLSSTLMDKAWKRGLCVFICTGNIVKSRTFSKALTSRSWFSPLSNLSTLADILFRGFGPKPENKTIMLRFQIYPD